MNRYLRSYLIAAVFVSIPLALYLLEFVLKGRLLGIAFISSLLVVLWGLYHLLCKNIKYSFQASFALISVCWALLAYQTSRRVLFIIENDSLEGEGGRGSPLAFLIGLIFEQFIFLPLTIVFVSGLVGLINGQLSFFGKIKK